MSHPEFGYFCPAPRLRREVRVAFFAIAFGALIGSIAVTALSTRARNPEAESATVGSALVPEAPPRSDRKEGSREIDAVAGTARTSKSEAVDEQASTAHSFASPIVESEKPATNLNPCQEKSSTSAQGHCVAEKFSSVRRAPVNNTPDVARVLLGRPTALEAEAPMSAPTAGAANLDLQTPQITHQPATASPLGAEGAAREGVQSHSALPKKPHKIARAQNRHRSEKSERRVVVRRGWEGEFGALDRAYARDSSFAPMRGFWVWSW